MKDHNPHDPVNIIGEAYELFIERTLHDPHARTNVSPEKPSQSIYRMINKSHEHRQPSQWIENKKYLIKNIALDYLKHAGDKTTIALRRLNSSQNSADKPVTHESSPRSKSHQPRHNLASLASPKTDTHQYKKCNNKAFRRLQ